MIMGNNADFDDELSHLISMVRSSAQYVPPTRANAVRPPPRREPRPQVRSEPFVYDLKKLLHALKKKELNQQTDP